MLKISLNSESEYINIYYYTIFLYILFFSDINVCSYSFRGDFSNFENLFENVTFEKYSQDVDEYNKFLDVLNPNLHRPPQTQNFVAFLDELNKLLNLLIKYIKTNYGTLKIKAVKSNKQYVQRLFELIQNFFEVGNIPPRNFINMSVGEIPIFIPNPLFLKSFFKITIDEIRAVQNAALPPVQNGI